MYVPSGQFQLGRQILIDFHGRAFFLTVGTAMQSVWVDYFLFMQLGGSHCIHCILLMYISPIVELNSFINYVSSGPVPLFFILHFHLHLGHLEDTFV